MGCGKDSLACCARISIPRIDCVTSTNSTCPCGKRKKELPTVVGTSAPPLSVLTCMPPVLPTSAASRGDSGRGQWKQRAGARLSLALTWRLALTPKHMAPPCALQKQGAPPVQPSHRQGQVRAHEAGTNPASRAAWGWQQCIYNNTPTCLCTAYCMRELQRNHCFWRRLNSIRPFVLSSGYYNYCRSS